MLVANIAHLMTLFHCVCAVQWNAFLPMENFTSTAVKVNTNILRALSRTFIFATKHFVEFVFNWKKFLLKIKLVYFSVLMCFCGMETFISNIEWFDEGAKIRKYSFCEFIVGACTSWNSDSFLQWRSAFVLVLLHSLALWQDLEGLRGWMIFSKQTFQFHSKQWESLQLLLEFRECNGCGGISDGLRIFWWVFFIFYLCIQ